MVSSRKYDSGRGKFFLFEQVDRRGKGVEEAWRTEQRKDMNLSAYAV